MSKYYYKPLNTKKEEIRIVHLLPGSSTDDLRLHIFHVPFSRAIELKYEALSYTWGSEEQLQPIHVSRLSWPSALGRINRVLKGLTLTDDLDAGILAVTPNLANALKCLRQLDRPLRLWIDAICIDQANEPEKSREVNRMGDIYREAGSVLVWLGPKSSDSDLAMNTIEAVARQTKSFGDDTTLRYIITREGHPYPWDGISAEERDARRAAVQNILKRPWFSRLWVWQEIILSTNAFMICGNAVLPYGDFRKAILMALGELSHGESLHGCIDGRTRDRMSRMMKMPRQSPSLAVLINTTKYAMCKDPRDRVYALRTLLSVEMRAAIKPDYRKTSEEVFRDAVLSCITNLERLELLTFCEMRFPTDWASSWVPDLGNPRCTTSISFGHASGYCKPEVRYLGGKNLSVQGVHATSVAEIICVFTQQATYRDIIPPLQELAHKLFYLVETEAERMKTAKSFIALLTCLHSAFEDIDSVASTTPEDFRQDLLNFVNADLATSPLEALSKLELMVYASKNCPGRAIYKTTEGYLGLGPAAVEIGDHTCVLLGSNTPLILRPVIEHPGNFKVVGETFVCEFMDKQALLGPIPSSVISWYSRFRTEEMVLYLENGIATEEDPRLGILPQGWDVYLQDCTSDTTTKLIPPGFEKLPTLRRRIRRPTYDSRVTADKLRARGVGVKTLNLV